MAVWAIKHVVAPVHRWAYRRTGGRMFGFGLNRNILLLTTTGRKTGRSHTTPAFFVRDSDRLVVCNVRPGSERTNPWVLNLRANPSATVQIGADIQASEHANYTAPNWIATGRNWLHCGPPTVSITSEAVSGHCSSSNLPARRSQGMRRRGSGSVVDVHRRVSEGEIPRVLVGTHDIAAPVGRQEGTGAARHQADKSHATLPGAVRLDGSIAFADDAGPAVLAAGVGRRRCGDQPSGHQHGSQSSDDAVLHGCLPSHRRWRVAEYSCRQTPSTAPSN